MLVEKLRGLKSEFYVKIAAIPLTIASLFVLTAAKQKVAFVARGSDESRVSVAVKEKWFKELRV